MTTSLYEIMDILSKYSENDKDIVDFVSYLWQTGKIDFC